MINAVIWTGLAHAQSALCIIITSMSAMMCLFGTKTNQDTSFISVTIISAGYIILNSNIYHYYFEPTQRKQLSGPQGLSSPQLEGLRSYAYNNFN